MAVLEFTTTGKNKIDYLTAVPATAQTTTTFVTNGFRSVTTSSGYATKITMSIKPSTTYALSWDLSIEAQCSPFIRVYKGTITTSGNYVSQNVTSGAGSLSFTTDSDATDINIWFYNGSPAEGTTVWTFIQLEENTSATSYEPYTAGASPNPEYPQDIHVVTGDQTVTIGSTSYTLSLGSLELAKIGSYQDYIYKSGGNWYKHAEVGKVVLDGSENWSRDTTSGGETRYFRLDIADLIMLDASVLFPGYSNYYLPATGNAVYLRQVDYGVAVAGNTGRLRIRNKDIEATADFQTWLSTHNTTVYYALDTATDIQITDAGLIAQLEALWNARTVNGQTIITNSAVSPNLAAILTVDAFTNGWAGTNAGFTEEIARLEARVEALEA